MFPTAAAAAESESTALYFTSVGHGLSDELTTAPPSVKEPRNLRLLYWMVMLITCTGLTGQSLRSTETKTERTVRLNPGPDLDLDRRKELTDGDVIDLVHDVHARDDLAKDRML